jgi:hypothetical protein
MLRRSSVIGRLVLASRLVVTLRLLSQVVTPKSSPAQARRSHGGITVDSYGGTVELADAMTMGTRTITVTNGTFDTKGYNVTAAFLSSSNSNVREIKLGASTVTLIGSLTFTTSTNLTFDAGTSSIVNSANTVIFNGGGQTFYDVSLTSTSPGFTSTINQSNTFNSLSITAPASAGMRQFSFTADQTITGTLTVSGASAIRRTMLRSSAVGTTRTLTVGTLSADDCDFRDITIAGTAAGGSPTRAGDCGGNSGVTFPAPEDGVLEPCGDAELVCRRLGYDLWWCACYKQLPAGSGHCGV